MNVFNEADLRLGSAHFVLFETDPEGNVLRVVPFLDARGGRLDYMRNDLLYFGHSLPWQRSPRGEKFVGGDPSAPSEDTRALMRHLARLDACLSGPPQTRHYAADVFVQELVEHARFKAWSEPVRAARVRLVVSRKGLEQLGSRCRYAFDLPPGHFASESRAEAALRSAAASAVQP